MRNVVPSRRSCLVFAAFVLAAITFVPVGSFAQDNAAASPDQDLMQNVKAIYFPFNIYSRVVNPDVLQADGDYLKQHPSRSSGYRVTPTFAAIFSTTWCFLIGGRSS